MNNMEPKKKIIAGLNHQSHLTESAGVLEPEKKDVWEEEFDLKYGKWNVYPSVDPEYYKEVVKGIKSFIKTHFIPRAEVVEKMQQLAQSGRRSDEYLKAFDDLLTILTQEK